MPFYPFISNILYTNAHRIKKKISTVIVQIKLTYSTSEYAF